MTGMVNTLKISIVMLTVVVIGFLSGCDNQPEPKKPAPVRVVVSGKILPPSPVKTGEKSVSQPEVIVPVKTDPAKTDPAQTTPTDSENKNAEKMVQVLSKSVAPESLEKEPAGDGIVSGEPDNIQTDTTEAVARYDSTGKLNPFLPLIQEKEEKSVAGVVKDEKPKRVLTPLEKLELSQIKLVAVVLMKNRQLAMVEEASGKGYEVNIGTYMGKNSGQVSEINQSSIVVKEYVKDYKGKLQAQFQEIKLQKKEGGE